MSIEQSKPPFLYHGSQSSVDIIKPEQTHGEVKEDDRLCAVYASHNRRFAITAALPILPDPKKGLSWGLRFEGEEPRVKIIKGWLHPSQAGYLYRVPSDAFNKIDEYRWVSSLPVTPLDCEIIHPWDYLHWFETKKVVLKQGSFEKRRNDQRFALAVTFSRIMNSLTSTWRLSLSQGKQNNVIAQRERMQAFLNNVAVLHEGIQTFCDNKVHLHELDWFKAHLEDIKVIDKEIGDSKSFFNSVIKEVRNKLTFHFNSEVDSELLSNPDIKLDHPLVLIEGISMGIGDSIHPLADKLIEEFLIHKYKQSTEETVKFEEFLLRFEKLQHVFVNVIGHLMAELVKDDIEFEGEE